ncbi:MAG: hypothetical protein ACJAYU_003472 [Bradymonadia bacterium]|jgi:hypothetical protein
MWTRLSILLLLVPGAAAAQDHCLPSAAATVDKALIVAGLDVVPDFGRRARVSSLLPSSVRLELRTTEDDLFRNAVDVDQDFDETLQADGIDLSDTQSTGIDHLREARLVVYWQLDSLVWSNESLTAMRYRDARLEAASDLSEAVLSLYFDLLSQLDLATRSPESWEPRAAEYAWALLDERTDGWFSASSECRETSATSP